MNDYKINEREYFSLVRKRKNITLKEIATYIKCSISLLSKYEKGHINLPDDKLFQYKRYINDK